MTTLATNLISKATTQLKSFPFVGFVKIGSKVLGVSPSGLYELTSTTAATFAISELVTASKAFKSDYDKRFPILYIRAIASKDFRIAFVIDDQETESLLVDVPKPGLGNYRVTVPRDIRGSSWSVKIISTGGYLKVLQVTGIPTLLRKPTTVSYE